MSALGWREREVAAAEQVLKDYIAKKYAPTRKEQDLEKIPVADVLSIFIDDRRELRRSEVSQSDLAPQRVLGKAHVVGGNPDQVP